MTTLHKLYLDVPEIANPYVLNIRDVSVYAETPAVTDLVLKITIPGWNMPMTQAVSQPYFYKNLSSIDLGIQTTGSTPSHIPDGVYVIEYSAFLDTNKIKVDYYHLRTTQLMNKYYGILGKVSLDEYEPSVEQTQKLQKLYVIKMYIAAAKAMVENSHAPKK
jgi:hypothetical protein